MVIIPVYVCGTNQLWEMFVQQKTIMDTNCLSLPKRVMFLLKIVSKYDQEIPQSQIADNPMAPRGRATQPITAA